MAQHVLHTKFFKNSLLNWLGIFGVFKIEPFFLIVYESFLLHKSFFVTEKGYKIVKRFATLRFVMDPFWKI